MKKKVLGNPLINIRNHFLDRPDLIDRLCGCKLTRNPGGFGPPFRHISENRRLFFPPQDCAGITLMMSDMLKKHLVGLLRLSLEYV